MLITLEQGKAVSDMTGAAIPLQAHATSGMLNTFPRHTSMVKVADVHANQNVWLWIRDDVNVMQKEAQP